MRKDLRWRLILIAAVTVLAAYLIFPVEEKVRPGLDLKGGIHLVLRVKTADAVKTSLNLTAGRLSEVLGRRGLRHERIDADEKTASLVVVNADQVAAQEFSKVFGEELSTWSVAAEDGGYRLTMPADQVGYIRETAVTDTLERIRRRVDAYGVVEPNVQRQGLASDRVLIQLPGVDNPERVKGLLSTPAFLEFKLVSYPPGMTEFHGVNDRQALENMFAGSIPADTGIYEQEIVQGDAKAVAYWPLKIASPLNGSDLIMARRGQDNLGRPAVDFSLTAEAGNRFERLTTENVGRQLAITLDGKLVSAPRINSVINQSGIIEGQFTIEEADDLALKLRSGALPAGTLVLEERTVGPSLGRDSIRKGVSASIAGLAVSIVFMVLYYRGAGLNAVVALGLNVLLILGTMSYLGATLSLPGIAGIILTFGMAFDANVLIFERIREELRAGKTVRAAVDAGFKKAFTAIFDSNLTTVICAIFLIQFGTGPVKGFAVSLCIGLAASMFTAIFVSRALFHWRLGEGKRIERLSI